MVKACMDESPPVNRSMGGFRSGKVTNVQAEGHSTCGACGQGGGEWGEWGEGVFQLIRNGSKDYSVEQPISLRWHGARSIAPGERTCVLSWPKQPVHPLHEESTMNHSVRLATTLAGITAVFAMQSITTANPGLLHKHARGAVGAPAMLPGQMPISSTATQGVAAEAVTVSSDGVDT
jgi:hypothetical protein